MRMTGLSEVIGSWKTMATSVPQIVRLSFSLAPTTSKPSMIDEPVTVVLTRGCRPMIVRESTVLPEPDSPTMPRVSLRSRSNETSRDGGEVAPGRREGRREVLDDQEGVVAHSLTSVTSKCERMRSPMKLSAMRKRHSARDGKSASQGF